MDVLDEGDHEATLTVLSNDPERPYALVEVTAHPRIPTIVPDPEEVIWQDADGGLERLRIRNEGDGLLRISSLALVDDGGGVFRLDAEWLPPLMGANEESYLDLSALPSDGAAGTLRIASNDPLTPVLDVPLRIGASVSECPDESWPEGEVAVDNTCLFDGLNAVWDPAIETAWRAFPTHMTARFAAQATVGRLTDDNGDGVIDDQDPPDICVVMSSTGTANSTTLGVLRILASDSKDEHWSLNEVTWDGATWGPTRQGPCALGDVDSDGEPEVVLAVKSLGGAFGLASFSHEGDLEWLTPLTLGQSAGTPQSWMMAPAIADLDGNGEVEVVLSRNIVAGADGTLLARGTGTMGSSDRYVNGGPKSVPIDLDGDGEMEILAGPTLMDMDGNTLCELAVEDGYPAAADLDGDGLGEVVISGSAEVVVFDGSCAEVASWPTPDGGSGGPPTLADFDGDGEVEIGIASKYSYYVFETDGTVLWSAPIRDVSSHSTGSAVFDFDGDGSAEVVFADEYDLFVLDGLDGRVRFLWTGHASGTGTELPIIADVDDDGSAEIVLCHGGYRDTDAVGCTVVGSDSSGWMPARPVWNQHAFSMSHINDDLSVPSDTSPNWPELNTFRSADTLAGGGGFDRNARPALVEVCNLDCEDDTQRVVVRVENPGAEDLPAGLRVELRSTIAGTETTIAWQVVEEPIPSGTSSAGLAFDVDLDLMPERDLFIVVDPEDLIKECDEDDNRLPVNASLCP